MAELMLVNPRRRKRRAKSTTRRRVTRVRRNPRVKARRKMSAAQAAYFGPRKRRRRSARRAVAASAPRSRRRYSRRSGGRSLKSALTPRGIIGQVMPAAIGAGGALAIDALWAVLPIPENLKTGTFAPAIKALGVIGIGAVASKVKVLPQKMVTEAVAASLTIMAYNFLKGQLQAVMPSLPLGAYVDGMGYYQAGQFMPEGDGVSGYITGDAGVPALSGYSATYYGDESADMVS